MAENLAVKTLLQRWPETVPRKGIVVTSLNEASPFKSFMLNNEMVAFERSSPDALGARYMMMAFSEISCIKLVDPTTTEAFNKLGFEGKMSGG